MTLGFSPQLTVIYGPNEAGKSSWHAAIYAALCGMRRGRGQPRLEDRDFTDLRRPWSGGAWEVRALIRLHDGRHVELRQDLSDLAHCSAIDADLGRDVSGEILNDGTPDAAKWLGLDRQSFLSVACVRQAEIQAVAESAASLQDELQRAAASVASDATAAEAITRLEDFLRDHVGQDRANSTKPLQRAKMRLAAAELRLTNARQKHAEWLTVEAEALELRKKADDQTHGVLGLHALCARREADAWKTKLTRAQELSAKYPTGPTPLLPDEDRLAGDVASSLSEWANRPEVPILTGLSAADIRAKIAALPPMPVGDQAPTAQAVIAWKAYERASHALELHESQRPSAERTIDAKGLTADQLRELARALEISIPTINAEIERAYDDARARLEAAQRSSVSRPIVVGLTVALVVIGIAVWALSSPLVGAALVISGVIAFVWLVFRSGEGRRARALEAVRAVESQVLSERKAMENAREQVDSASKRIAELGLPFDPGTLRELADELLLVERHRQAVVDWSRNHEGLQSSVTATRNELMECLRRGGVSADGMDVVAAYQEYERACQARAEQTALASSRQPLDQRLLDREAAEQAASDAEARRSKAAETIRDTLARCGLEARDEETAVEELRLWQYRRNKLLADFDEATREYAQLEALLDGGTLTALDHRTTELQQQAAALEATLDQVPALPPGVNLDEEVRRAEKIAHDAGDEATAAETRARDRARNVPSVAESEEESAEARRELERIERLNQTLTRTLDFLRKAEERVHRDIAPVLAAGLRRWLADVTQGRYTDARVDPSDLCVQVLGPDGQWRKAQRLSHGTAEQIYLLLRVVLAERLTSAGETCPLILDDVLVQCDNVRKRALLSVISAISRTRQVILLTQEEEVLQWAQQTIVSPDQLITLPGTAS